ncbi:MAG: glycoside hydrolase, partial [Ramlibacter sp.]|nr:glycoside hydrolase [Ramlibacter sp.]
GHHIRYTRSADGARSFEPPREISRPMPQGSVSAGFPALAVDGAGRVYVLWELYAQRRQPPRGLALVVSGDGGDSFAGPATVPGSADAAGGFNGSGQGLTNKLAVNRRGAIAIVNSSLKVDSHSRVWLMRGAMPR